MRVPQYQRNVSPASNLGQPRQNPNMYAPRDAAVKGFLTEVDDQVEAYKDKQVNTILAEELNRLDTVFNKQLIDDGLNRQGEAARANEKEGIKSVYGAFLEKSEIELNKSLDRLPDGKRKEAAKQRLQELLRRHGNNFATLEARETQVQRNNAINNTYVSIQDQINVKAKDSYADPNDIKALIKEYSSRVNSLTGGQDRSGEFKVKANMLRETAILSMAEKDPVKAKDLLNDKAFTKEFTGDKIKSLRATIKERRVTLAADSMMLKIPADMPYSEQLEFINGIKDEDVRNAVSVRANVRNTQYERAKVTNQSALYEKYWDRIKNGEGDIPSVTEIRTDTGLASNQKEHLEALLTSGGGGSKAKELAKKQAFAAEQVQSDVITGRMSLFDLKKAMADDVISIPDYKKILEIKTALDNDNMQNMGYAVTNAMSMVYESITDKGKASKIQRGIAYGYNEYMRETGKRMPDNEILKLAEELVKPQREFEIYGIRVPMFDGKPIYESESMMRGIGTKAAHASMMRRYPQAQFDEASQLYLVGFEKGSGEQIWLDRAGNRVFHQEYIDGY